MTFWLNARTQTLFDNVVAVRAVRSEAVDLQSAIQTAESSQRGYLYTHNEIYLAPFTLSQTRALQQLSLLQNGLADYPDLKAASKRLGEVVNLKFLEMNQTISLEQQYRGDEAKTLVGTNRGKALMDEATALLRGITRAADQRLVNYIVDQQSTAAQLKSISVLSVLVILVVILIVYRILVNYTRELNATKAEVLAINTGLEIRVQERTEALGKANSLLRAAQERAEALLVEVNHRVSNSLAMVATLVKMQANSITNKSAKDALAETGERISAISLVHRKLYTAGDVGFVMADDYLAGLLSNIEASIKNEQLPITLTSKITPLKLPVDRIISFGVICNELISNAIKYAYPDKAGEIRLELEKLTENKAVLAISDKGVGFDPEKPPEGTGFGSKIINAMAVSLDAKITHVQGNPGTIVRMTFSLTNLSELLPQEPAAPV